MKTVIIAASVLLLVAGGIFVYRTQCMRSATADDCGGCASDLTAVNAAIAAEPDLAPDSTAVIIAYYFHTTQRCANCYKIETYTGEAIETEFAAELQSGRLIWRMVNTDETANEHFLTDYKLYTKSVVLVDMRDGKQVRWKNLEKVWTHLRDKEKFQKYVRDEVRAWLGT